MGNKEWEPLSEWNEASIVTTQCTNTGAVVEWVFDRLIEEEEEEEYVNQTTASSPEGSEVNTSETSIINFKFKCCYATPIPRNNKLTLDCWCHPMAAVWLYCHNLVVREA